MKKQYLLFLIVLAVVSLFISCEKGGTIEVTNQEGGVGVYNGQAFVDKNIVTVVRLDKLGDAVTNITNGNGTLMTKGQKKSFPFDADGVYVVVAMYPTTTVAPFIFNESVTLLGGGTQYVTIMKKP